MKHRLALNGSLREVEADPAMPLLWVLRDLLGMTGSKFGCGAGLCGACTVLVDGEPVRGCVTPLGEVGDARVLTIEGVAATPIGRKVQAAWRELDVVQCGYCQRGQIVAATALLTKTPQPTDADIDAAMAGNLCRCGTYPRIRAAIHKAAAG